MSASGTAFLPQWVVLAFLSVVVVMCGSPDTEQRQSPLPPPGAPVYAMRRGSERAGRLTDSTNACGVGEVEWNVGYAP